MTEILFEAEKRKIEEKFPYTIELFDPSQNPWERVRREIISLERGIYGDEAFDEETLQEGFEDPSNTIVIAREKGGRAIGYSWAKPAQELYQEEEDYEVFKGRTASSDTAYIYNTGLLPEFQKRGFVVGLYRGLESALLSRTDRKYNRIHRDSAVENGLAANIIKNNPHRIIQHFEHDSPYGRQMFIDMWIVPPAQPSAPLS